MHPDSDIDNNRLEINWINIQENKSFWFHTNMNHDQTNVNINKRYVHIHPGIGSTNKFRFEKEPFIVKRGDLFYNPKKASIEVKSSILPWKKPLYEKEARFYGSKRPDKKISIQGIWYYDHSRNSIYFIIDFFPQKIQWELVPEEATVEQYALVDELETKIHDIELKLLDKYTTS